MTNRTVTPVLRRFATNPGVFYDAGGGEPRSPTWWAADLRGSGDNYWRIQTYPFAEKAIRILDLDTSDSVTPPGTGYAFALSFERWHARSLTVVPGGFAIVEFGPAQVLLIDVEGRRVGVLATGYSPVVALDEPAAVKSRP